MKINYRPDIDGLRAMAIIPVVLFHAFPDFFPGGFIGVDIFFVISGFLISSIIFKEVECGKFSFLDFYSRRIRRIFPSLLVVALSVWFFSWVYFLSDDFKSVSKHVIFGLLFSQNIGLYFESGYFDVSTELKPLMHLWSLGVEEQFYIFFPIIVLLAKSKKSLLGWLLIVFLLSLTASVLLSPDHPSWSFYMPFTRMWELMSGCIASFILKYVNINFRIKHLHLTSVLAFLILFSCFFIIDKDFAFPGYIAILPVISTAAIIMCGPDSIVNRVILSSKLMVFIGLISFPLYLWHWPILSIMRILSTSEPSEFERVFACIASIALAFLTFFFVERLVRNYKNTNISSLVIICFSMLFVFVSSLSYSGVVGSRNNSKDIKDIVSAAGEWDYPNGLDGISFNGVPVKYIKGDRYTIFYGDSNVEEYSARIVSLAEKSKGKRGVIFLTSSGCLPVGGVYFTGYDECRRMPDLLNRIVSTGIADRVVISAIWYKYFAGDPGKNILLDNKYPSGSKEGTEIAVSRLGEIIKKLRKDKISVFLVMEKPTGKEFDPKNLVRRNRKGDIEVLAEGVDRFSLEKPFGFARSLMLAVAKMNGAHVISPMDHLCSKTLCMPVSSERKAIYKDDSHLRPSYVRDNVQYMDETMM